MTGKGLPKGDDKDYGHIFMRFLPTHFHDEPYFETCQLQNQIKKRGVKSNPRCSRRPRGPLARREQRGIISNGVNGGVQK
jgi:hypothetical protein